MDVSLCGLLAVFRYGYGLSRASGCSMLLYCFDVRYTRPNFLSVSHIFCSCSKMRLFLVLLLPNATQAAVTLLPRQHSNHGGSESGAFPLVSNPSGPWDTFLSGYMSTTAEWFGALTRPTAQKAKLFSVTKVTPKLRSDAIRKAAKYGPFTLKAKVSMASL
jgi:hypothetical protein